jgi:hypothetical protein
MRLVAESEVGLILGITSLLVDRHTSHYGTLQTIGTLPNLYSYIYP